MKKITLFLLLVCIGTCNLKAQERRDTLLMNFEDQTTGLFVNQGPNLTKSVVENPDKSGKNISEYVLRIDANSSVASWEALYSPNNTTSLCLNIDSVGNGYRYLHFKVYKNFISQMKWGLYIYNGGFQEKLPEYKSNTKLDEWEYIVVDLLWAKESYSVSAGLYYKLNFNINISLTPTGPYTGYIDDVYLSSSKTEVPNPTTNHNNTPSIKGVTAYRIDHNTVQIRANVIEGSLKMDVYNMQGQHLQSITNISNDNRYYNIKLPHDNLYILRVSDTKGSYNIKI